MLYCKCKQNFTFGGNFMDKQNNTIKKEKRVVVGEMEKHFTNKGNWLSVIIAGIIAVAFMIVEGALGHYSAIYAIGAICYAWASSLYFCQYFMAKRPWQVLIGGILHGLAFITMVVVYIISNI